MKLFVWEDVLTDYTSGIMFALADSADEARELISPGWADRVRLWKETDARLGTMDFDLRTEPDVYETPAGFSCWGGG